MKITIKNVKGVTFTVDAEAGTKVAELKAQIEAQQGDAYPASAQTLIYKGKVLKDETTVSENAIEEDKGFVVVMCKPPAKKPAAAAPAEPTASAAGPSATAAPRAADAPASTAAAPPAAADAPAAAAPAAPAAAAAAAGAPSDYSSAASALLSGPALETAVQSMCEMGFERDQVLRAMRAAFNNPERAVEYLMTGIPDAAMLAGPAAAAAPAAGAASAAAPPAAGAAAAGAPAAGAPGAPPAARAAPAAPAQPFNMFGGPPAPQEAPGAAAGAGAGGAGGGGPLDFLRSLPNFPQLRAAVQTNPSILVPMLQEMSKNTPELVQLINQHQQEFLQLIMEPGAGGEGGDYADVPAPIAIELSEEDEAAITRLEGMGFDRAACIEAFLACDKNEMLAANYLLENGGL